MVVSLGGRAVRMRVRPGPEGMAKFRQQVRELFNIPAHVEFECSFKCKAPSGAAGAEARVAHEDEGLLPAPPLNTTGTVHAWLAIEVFSPPTYLTLSRLPVCPSLLPPPGDMVQLEGLASYDAATHVASLTAAQRAAAAARRANSVPHHRVSAAGGSSSGAGTSAQQPYLDVHPADLQQYQQAPLHQQQQQQSMHVADLQHYHHPHPHCATPQQQPHLEAAHSAPQPLPQPLQYYTPATSLAAYPAGAPASTYPLPPLHSLFA